MDTIIQRLAMDDPAGNEFYIKRDDLLPFSIGGNKVRIAEAFYQDMKAKGRRYDDYLRKPSLKFVPCAFGSLFQPRDKMYHDLFP